MNKMGIAQASVAGGEASEVAFPVPVARIHAISPDRSSLLATAVANKSMETTLWSLRLPGGSPRGLNDIAATEGDWSPDGSKLVFVKGDDIFVANGDGTGARKLLSVSGVPSNVRFSPDGKRLRYTLTDATLNTDSLWASSLDLTIISST
jgi:dipeptidyl aminopeptidase/acylaminoacyl peptidase